jgi:hypothetical protein
MKHLSILIIGVVLSTLAGMSLSALAFGGDLYIERLFDEVGISQGPNNDVKELKKLGNGDVPFEHLYLYMYENIKEGPRNDAIKELNALTKYTKKELEAIIIEGDISRVRLNAIDLEGSDEEQAITTQSVLFEEYNSLTELYERELTFQTDQRKLSFEVLANEMFYDGDLNNSAGIDILADLDLIHLVLFGETIPFPDRQGDGVELASAVEPEPAVILAAEEPESDEINPLICNLEDDSEEAIQTYEEYVSELPEGRGALGEDRNALGGSRSAYDADNFGENGNSNVADLSDLDGLIDELRAKEGDWNGFAFPCTEVFCIKVNLVTQQADSEAAKDSYKKTDNSIAAHTSYINQRMKDTVSKSLTPGRISTNVFEDATCKEAGLMVGLDFNVFVITRGLDTEELSFDLAAKRAEKKLEEFKRVGAILEKGVRVREDELYCQSLVNLIDASGTGGDLTETLDACRIAAEQHAAAVSKAFEAYALEADVGGTDLFYEQMTAELQKMLVTFQSFKLALQATYLTEQAPLHNLISNTPICK